MLVELSIRNFAIIDSLRVPFESGLTVLTGETGAGKSIIIDAIGLLIGGRGSSEYVRHGEKKAEIEGLFQVEKQHPSHSKAKEFGIEINDGMIVLNREITSTGKSICRINGKLVTLAILREVGRTLIDIHGQHEHQFLLQSDQHIHLLDLFASDQLQQTLSNYKELYQRYQRLLRKLRNLTENEKEMAQRIDLLKYQIEEINRANLQPDEDNELYEERLKLNNFERLFKVVGESLEALRGETKGIDWIGHAMSSLEQVVDLDNELKEIHESVANAFYMLEDASFRLRDFGDQLEFNPVRLDDVEHRINEIKTLKRKYGSSVMEILEYAAKIEDELDSMINHEDTIQSLEHEFKEIKQDLWLEAQQLSSQRKRIAKILTDAIHEELRDLYMEKTKFSIDFNEIAADEMSLSKQQFYINGVDELQFVISTNPGEPLKPLAKIASGGELSRIILALKSIFSNHKGVASIIFDEVDTGVSGRVAQAIAEKIHALSVGSQVLCITHLPQVAAMGDTHMFIAKHLQDERTITSVSVLNQKDRINEIGRMLSGTEVTALTKEHAREMIQHASSIKVSS